MSGKADMVLPSLRLARLRHDGVGFNLHKPLRVDKTRHLNKSARGADRSEMLPVCTCGFTPCCHIDKHHSRSRSVLKSTSCFGDSRADDLQTSFSLSIDVAQRGIAAR